MNILFNLFAIVALIAALNFAANTALTAIDFELFSKLLVALKAVVFAVDIVIKIHRHKKDKKNRRD